MIFNGRTLSANGTFLNVDGQVVYTVNGLSPDDGGDVILQPIYSELHKVKPRGKDMDGNVRPKTLTLRVYLHGLETLKDKSNLSLKVYHNQRSRGQSSKWVRSNLGYCLLAGAKYGVKGDEELYPSIPAWMPNNGILQNIFSISDEEIIRGYVEIDVLAWLLPLLKPNRIDKKWDWEDARFIGLSRNKGSCGTHLFKFHIEQNNKIIGYCANSIAVGNQNIPHETETLIITDDKAALSRKFIYCSIR